MAHFIQNLRPLKAAAQTQAAQPKFSHAPPLPSPPDAGEPDFTDILRLMRPPKGIPAQLHPKPVSRPPVLAPGGPGGARFIETTSGMNRVKREEAILKAALSGNMPSHLKNMKPVTTSWTDPDGRTHTGQYFVTPDYLAIGNDQDAVRMPMSPLTAQKIADQWGAVLPTRKMVQQVYQQAEVKVAPKPMEPTSQMMSNDYYLRHNAAINKQLEGTPKGALVAGHKKDVVLTNALAQRPRQVAIYGWHQPNGKAIQGLSTVHENTYSDYSHGVRLVARTMIVDGKPMDIRDVMASPKLYGLVSDEGPLKVTRIPGA